jgi:hypothetical protein
MTPRKLDAHDLNVIVGLQGEIYGDTLTLELAVFYCKRLVRMMSRCGLLPDGFLLVETPRDRKRKHAKGAKSRAAHARRDR